MFVRSYKQLTPVIYRFKTELAKSPTAADVVAKSQGMNQFLNKQSFLIRTYIYSGGSFFTAIGAAHLAISAGLSPAVCLGGGLITSLVGIIGVSFTKPINADYHYQGYKIYQTKNSLTRLMLYWGAVGGIGITAAPIFQMANMMNPMILPQAMALTGAVFGGVSMIAYRMPPGKMLSYGRILGGSLLGLIGLSLSGLLSQYIFGPNLFSMMAHSVNTYVGLGLFSAFIAYDTHVGMKMYEQGNADHLNMAMSLFLDLWNILIRILQILMRSRME